MMNKLQRLLFSILAFIFFSLQAVKADEGMWLPLLLEKLNEKQMKSLGMKISASDIYSVNKGSLKDAIVSFGGFCTGEVISSKGLVLTNHHCGFDAIQTHSTIEQNYLRDGFWAKNNGQELPNPGLFVTFIVRIDDVTKDILAGVNGSMKEQERQSTIDKNIAAYRSKAKKETYQDVMIRGFFEGNQYYMFTTETFRDVRLVGAPPSAIGNFGVDTDNWVWPRHTGDFSMFRIYADKNNRPAAYSAENVPYTPKKSLSVSLDGTAENDFTMVFGFPGKTTEYLPSSAVKQIAEDNDPLKISIRDQVLSTMKSFMQVNERTKLQYSSKYAGIANAWKKWQGEVLGLQRTNAVGKKQAYEAEFMKRIQANPAFSSYKTILSQLDQAYMEIRPLGIARDYYLETVPRVELFTLANQVQALRKFREQGNDAFIGERAKRRQDFREIYKDLDIRVDKAIFVKTMEIYFRQPAAYKYAGTGIPQKNGQADYEQWANQLYGSSVFADSSKLFALFNDSPESFIATIDKDPAVVLVNSLAAEYRSKVLPGLTEIQNRINSLQRDYMQAQMNVFREKTFYPDANSTLRVTYGKVDDYEGRDALHYDIRTYLDGVMEKYIPGDYEFDVPKKLLTLYKNKDYGQYGEKGRMPVCFIAANHTTGGNSGSPALDAYGNLVGLNFDRVWEGTMSDINYDASICRNIMVDIRYVLFIIDKYGDAGHLVQEMKLVHPKKKGK